jgi:2-polyprenyl-3-methyl-5-hydroxy-6-metoxy-1,4-benzoquinol methylase
MSTFWESKYISEQTSWGFEPSDSAILANRFFLDNRVKEILVPGIGYGRNAKLFHDNGMKVTGIEISATAIELAKTAAGLDIPIHHGSVTDMPFDKKHYDGIFCYALIHLLNQQERKALICNCYNQLKPNGYMIFTVISTKAPMYGMGSLISKNRYEIMKGLNVFFYDETAVRREFHGVGLIEYKEIDEPIKHMENEPPLKCIWIKCRKAGFNKQQQPYR